MKLSKIILTRKEGDDLALSIDEAKEIYRELEELFGNKSQWPANPYVAQREWDAGRKLKGTLQPKYTTDNPLA